MPSTDTALAPQARSDELACRDRQPGGKYVCAAAAGHAGDHVPYGAADSDEGLRSLTWPQARARRSLRPGKRS